MKLSQLIRYYHISSSLAPKNAKNKRETNKAALIAFQ